MTQHDFSSLYEQYPNIIAQMGEEFTSHEFILKLAQQNQPQYIEALYAYRSSTHRGAIAPFRVVHDILTQRLSKSPLITKAENSVDSHDIFGRRNKCAGWRKINSP